MSLHLGKAGFVRQLICLLQSSHQYGGLPFRLKPTARGKEGRFSKWHYLRWGYLVMGDGNAAAARFRADPRSELPAEWRREVPANVLRSTAQRLGIAEAEAFTVFLLPDIPLAVEYAKWFTSEVSGREYVGICVQNRDTWAAAAPAGSFRRLVESLRDPGHPDFGNLGRVVGQRQTGAGSGRARGGSAQREQGGSLHGVTASLAGGPAEFDGAVNFR